LSAVPDGPRRPLLRATVLAVSLLAGAASAPRAWCGRAADAWFEGAIQPAEALARGVVAGTASVDAASLHTGNPRVDGESALLTLTMAELGLGQLALAHPDRRDALLPAMDATADRLLSKEATAFGTEAWNERGLDALAGPGGHAYLGQVALALGALRRVDPKTRFAPVHDGLVAALARRLEGSAQGLVETVPGETYPADVAAIVGAIALHAATTGADRRELLARSSAALRKRVIDPATGLVFHTVDAFTGEPTGAPRSSSTALAAYYLSYADVALARDLHRAAARQKRTLLGFGGLREGPAGEAADAGPALFGVSVAATALALGGARLFGDRASFTELWRTIDLVGVPVARPARTRLLAGGPLASAVLLAMATAPRMKESP
jgi:hypothetical protein